MKIEVLEVVENGDGTCNVVFDYDDEFVEMVKEEINKEEITEEDIAAFVVENLEKGIDLMKQTQDKE